MLINILTTLLIFFYFAVYPSTKICNNECSALNPCGLGYICKQIGSCNRCRPIEKVVIDPLPECITECRTSLDCGLNAVCRSKGCSRVCEVDPLVVVDPRPVLPIIGCQDECLTSASCGLGYVCTEDFSNSCRARRCVSRGVSGGLIGAIGGIRRGVVPVGPVVNKLSCKDLCIDNSGCLFNEICAVNGCRKECVRRSDYQ